MSPSKGTSGNTKGTPDAFASELARVICVSERPRSSLGGDFLFAACFVRRLVFVYLVNAKKWRCIKRPGMALRFNLNIKLAMMFNDFIDARFQRLKP